ncbi:MAG: UDP-N-acetylmuramoyl-L-alanine--D-glutamate ligase [Thermodesulfovibrionia bacterium]|nr:UDP-N-acetylmuramoyl-L-alanine--D-glutamate ligase [Thermodesulfovibrionia bacterium]
MITEDMDITVESLKNKNVLVVGLARSGTGAANLLSFFGANVTVTDTRPQSSLEGEMKRLSQSVKAITGGNPEEAFTSADLIVVSPGVPMKISPIVNAMKIGIPVIGELELAYEIVKSYKSKVKSETPDFIGITGTNGKSTTTTLIDLMLRESGFHTMLGGNIGAALTEEIYKLASVAAGLSDIDLIVAEISSFQLESIKYFRPKIALIMNITPDHLDRYDTLNDYAEAKERIYENQGEGDYLILNADDTLLKKIESEKLRSKQVKPDVLYFSLRDEVIGIYYKDGIIYYNLPSKLSDVLHPSIGEGRSQLISVSKMKIKGTHNLENAMAASLTAILSGASAEGVRNVLADFTGLEHRNEVVRILNGITFINDSKGTNVGAVEKSLENFESVILIMGGRDKGGDFSALRDLVKDKVKLLVLLGEAKEKIADSLGDIVPIEYAKDMKSAVELSVSRASEGDTVLLSPGCTSFDMFKDFEDRGRIFKEAVNAIRSS